MNDLQILAQNREAIILAELGALIHDVGKLSSEFVIQQSLECHQRPPTWPGCDFEHEQVLRKPSFLGQSLTDLLQDNTWQRLLQIRNPNISQLRQAPEYIGHFISGHTNLRSGKGLLALVTRCDQVDSGVDKGMLQNSAKQRLNATFLASSFGYEHILPISQQPDYLTNLRQHWAQQIENPLKSMRSGVQNQNRLQIIQETRRAFQCALGETRRAANDVSLWDHAYSVASLMKAALAQVLLTGQWPSDLREIRWRILRVGFDGLQFLESAHRIPDLLARLELLNRALDEVKELIEFAYPMGNEVYRDENGAAFVVPDVNNLLDITDGQGNTLQDLIRARFEGVLQHEIRLDLDPQWLGQASRYAIELGRLLQSTPSFLLGHPEVCATWWSGTSAEVCTVCNLRPQGPSKKSLERRVCDTCEQRRSNRAEVWATQGLGTTIWLDEATDQNGRLALIAGYFDLSLWMNGSLLSTMLVQEFPIQRGTYTDIVQQLAAELQQNILASSPQQSLLGSLAPEAFQRQTARDFYQSVAVERDIHGIVAHISASDFVAQAEYLLLSILRKNPSFARLRRIWETTRRFWQEVCPTDEAAGLANSLVGQAVGRAGPRLEIRGNLKPQEPGEAPGPYHTYDLVLPGGVKLSVVWDAQNSRFITCDNLEYLEGPTQLGRPVREVLKQGTTLRVEEPVGYGAPNKVWGEITLTADAVPIPGSEYTPAIPILAEPRTFMVLVPANRALEVVKAIKTKYEREMGKVRNRLPLHLGIVFADSHTPLRTILDAGKRMLKQRSLPAGWTVSEVRIQPDQGGRLPARFQSDAHFARWLEVDLEKDGRHLTWFVPAVMGDGLTEDVWYPYVFLEQDANLSGRNRYFKSINPWNDRHPWLVHAAELRPNDRIYFTPATLDWVWLDSAGRRFEVAYDEKGCRRGLPRRPYFLDELEVLERIWETLKSHLTKTQIYTLVETIELRRETWRITGDDDTFQRLCRDALTNAEWRKNSAGQMPWEIHGRDRDAWLDEWTDYAVRGWLADAFELHLQILKEEVK